MWVGIHNRIASASKRPMVSIEPVPSTRPAKIGMPPDMPPHTMGHAVFREPNGVDNKIDEKSRQKQPVHI